MDFKRILPPPKEFILVLCFITSLVISPVSAAKISDSDIQKQEINFQQTTSKIYSALAKNFYECRDSTSSLKSLNILLKKLEQKNEQIIGICTIQNHIPLIEKNIDNKEIFPIIQFLLNNNSLTLANKIFSIAKSEGDKSLVSYISFIYAKYYLKRKKWKNALSHIQGTYNNLAPEDANLARLFTGIALQKTKKHRQAVKVYSKIPQQSKHYPSARLNIATAYIRQDWWTDAHIKIKEILNDKKIKTNNEMINRLYLVLGYSLLRKEFYRDSRETFRNIEIDSIYFNKALLGIALTATNQEDYIGALNAINILKSKKSYDLSVDESHLLLPYTYEKLGQNMTASASYTEAQQYYQNRISSIKTLNINKTLSAKSILDKNNIINIENNIVEFTKHYPLSFLENTARINSLEKYMRHTNNKNLKSVYKTTKHTHNIILNRMLSDIFNKRLSYLNSYLNQSRFGLARLFDNSNIVQN